MPCLSEGIFRIWPDKMSWGQESWVAFCNNHYPPEQTASLLQNAYNDGSSRAICILNWQRPYLNPAFSGRFLKTITA